MEADAERIFRAEEERQLRTAERRAKEGSSIVMIRKGQGSLDDVVSKGIGTGHIIGTSPDVHVKSEKLEAFYRSSVQRPDLNIGDDGSYEQHRIHDYPITYNRNCHQHAFVGIVSMSVSYDRSEELSHLLNVGGFG